MISSLTFSDEVRLEDRIRRYEVDREERLEDLFELYPRLRGQGPGKLVENVLTDVCHYFIQERPLPISQLGLCNVRTRRVIYNSEVRKFVGRDVNLEHLRRTTMAHELGHARLHQDEMEQRQFISYLGSGHFLDNRTYQRELEADMYAAVFLVPSSLLELHRPFQDIKEAHVQRDALSSSQIWYRVYRLASLLEVTPTLMCRSLELYGWITKERTKQRSRHNLKIRRQPRRTFLFG